MIKDTLYAMGYTEDFKILTGGIFRMYTEKGFPVSDTINLFNQHKDTHRMCMLEFVFDALSENWDDEKIANFLYESYRDSVIGVPPYDILRMIELIIDKHWDGKESFEQLGKRMITQYRTNAMKLRKGDLI